MDYQKGKIYKIESHLGDKIYVGSTTKKYLSERMTAHRQSYCTWKKGNYGKVRSFELFEEYGIENCNIILLELCPCKSKDELNAKEAHYIRTLKCVNKVIPGRTQKQYIEENKNKIKEYDKQYKKDNTIKIKEQNKQYREDNKDIISRSFICECGCELKTNHKTRHERTKKHIELLKNKTN